MTDSISYNLSFAMPSMSVITYKRFYTKKYSDVTNTLQNR